MASTIDNRGQTTAKRIWIPSMYGTYIITPDHLSRDRPIRFLGVEAEIGGMPTTRRRQIADVRGALPHLEIPLGTQCLDAFKTSPLADGRERYDLSCPMF
jgi:hypothetical protein